MSALPPKADIVRRGDNVRFVPKADIRRFIIQRLDRTEKGIRFPASALLNVDGLRLVRRLPRHMFRTKALCIRCQPRLPQRHDTPLRFVPKERDPSSIPKS
jgi:hypothetical protein